ncbi:iron-sulfur cluster assembly scaffold protein [Alphaproteobacteria bacterium]|nr:iron-sulfur cluster assembly scaffold protein [Alphaproteobacteria bacterium]MDB2388451.1 iron-sulfur cluster assembly scaffold protein [Alphaproteobacteria bacterium]MDB2683972.1 iron-sulfur cluster assembly scaffold protein [Alphaproteobacteria bacterium]MDC0969834.1 iron-sulfur cluster assembly scaffold protein [Alphaproteobacteria bacterium]MDC1087204.1 iron-sulfur cluster assembly scaffold protein [Alphaproteobacteria bacterium]
MNELSIYQDKILSLAAENKKSIAIQDFNRSYEMKNPMCGDEVKVRIKLLNNQIDDISAIVRGCALCEASAGLTVKLFKKSEMPNSNFIEEFLNWLEYKNQNLSNSLPQQMNIFTPIRDIKNRHKCITMPFEATIKSIKEDI